MASTSVELANMALAHLGSDRQITSLSASGKEERTCTLFYEQARNHALGDFNWPFARKYATLALVLAPPTETSEWGYSYRTPSDAMNGRIRRVMHASSIRSVLAEDQHVYQLGQDVTGGLIYTDLVDAMVEYTYLVTDVTKFPFDFVTALTYLLAGLIAPSVTGGDQFKLGERALRLYDWSIRNAWANALNSEQRDLPDDSEFVRVR